MRGVHLLGFVALCLCQTFVQGSYVSIPGSANHRGPQGTFVLGTPPRPPTHNAMGAQSQHPTRRIADPRFNQPQTSHFQHAGQLPQHHDMNSAPNQFSHGGPQSVYLSHGGPGPVQLSHGGHQSVYLSHGGPGPVRLSHGGPGPVQLSHGGPGPVQLSHGGPGPVFHGGHGPVYIQPSRNQPPHYTQQNSQRPAQRVNSRPLTHQQLLQPGPNGVRPAQIQRINKLPQSVVQYVRPTAAKSHQPSEGSRIQGLLQDVASNFGIQGQLGSVSKGETSLFDLLFRVQNALGNWNTKLTAILSQLGQLFNPSFFKLVTSARNFIKAFNNSPDDHDDDYEEGDDDDDDYYDDDDDYYDDDDDDDDDYDDDEYDDDEYHHDRHHDDDDRYDDHKYYDD